MPKSQVIEKTTVETIEAPEGPTCQHHWKIGSPMGALSAGVCKRCGEEREFRNSTDYAWDNDSKSGGYSPWRGVRASKTTNDDHEGAATPSTIGGVALV